MVKPLMKRSRKRVNTKAMGTATRMAAAWSGCQKKTSPRMSSVGTPVDTTFSVVGEMKARA